MAHSPAMRAEAYELYLLGNSPADIAKELARRHPGEDTPSAKTLENWAYVPEGGRTWSERRYEAEAAARDAVTKDFVTARQKLMTGMLKLHARLEERAMQAAEESETGNFSQEIFAFLNLTKTVEKMLDSKLAEETRRKDAIDCLIEAMRRVVPKFEEFEPKIQIEFRRLVAGKEGAGG